MEKQKEKQKKEHNAGITLIALIITIIILLILAMVTIRILMNQGIIKHAQNATEAYNNAQNNETEYLTYAEGEMDKYAGATGSSSGSGGDTYTPPAEDLDALRRYFLGVKEDGSINEEGQSLMTHTSDGTTWEDDEATIGPGSNVSMFMTPYGTFKDGQLCVYFYIKYKNKDAYRLVLDESSNVKDVGFVYRPQGAEGETRTYKGEQWTVLYDKGTILELVSPKTIGTYTLGKNDPNATGSTDIEKAINSYNNAVTRLNAFCRTTLADNTARSVGSNSNNPDSDNPGMYESENLKSWNNTYNGVGKKTDDNGEQDFVRMVYHGVNVATNEGGNTTWYWLASRIVSEDFQYVFFCLGIVDRGGNASTSDNNLWSVKSDGNIEARDRSYGVRACVTVAK